MDTKRWALILGSSSGFGAATALALSKAGYSIAGVHLDRKGTMGEVERIVNAIKGAGQEPLFFNVNAADEEKRKEVLDAMQQRIPKGGVKILMHSLAFGALKPYITDQPADSLTKAQMDMTHDVMAHSLVYWTQDVFWRGLMGKGGRVVAMTSEGSTRVWAAYGAVSAAKCALESHVRQLALELAPKGITVNAIRAGVTDTPALRKIPDHLNMIKESSMRNPMGRMTTPQDVADAIVLLADDRSHWMTGNVLGVDGGERNV